MRTTKFFWSAAVILSLWELLVEPLFTEVVMVACTSAVSLDFPRPGPGARLANSLGDWLAWLQPVLLALAAVWAIRSSARSGVAAPRTRGSGGAAGLGRGVSLLPVTLGLAAAVLPYALTETGDLLTPPMSLGWRECLDAQLPTPSFVVPGMILTWLLSPAAMVLLAGITGAGNRPRLTDVRNTALAVAVVVAAVVLPDVLAGPPYSADGTPRYAVVGWGRSYVIDLESGEALDLLPRATQTYVQYDLVVRDVEPGRYVAAISVPWSDRFRLYRLSVNADGQVTLGERLTPTLKGTVNGLAVSPEGRIAYGRLADGAEFAGTLEREWPVNGYHLQWLDARTLLLPDHRGPVNTMATLDVDTGAIREVAAPATHEPSHATLPLPGGRQLRALGWPTRTLALYEGTRLIKNILTVDCGHIEALALAPTGRHVMVGLDREADEMDRSPIAGLPPCGGARAQLLRLDLETGTTQVVPGEQDSWIQAW
ncbi:hypothetical protein AB0K60_27780 [Thermopolyspora sp. NPDC052614]|uniref:hypothetical protein n=1 Tax=Thermopolyspora sp. NPDC052614 TaxID=3155682 RepID=UPI0034263CEF